MIPPGDPIDAQPGTLPTQRPFFRRHVFGLVADGGRLTLARPICFATLANAIFPLSRGRSSHSNLRPQAAPQPSGAPACANNSCAANRIPSKVRRGAGDRKPRAQNKSAQPIIFRGDLQVDIPHDLRLPHPWHNRAISEHRGAETEPCGQSQFGPPLRIS